MTDKPTATAEQIYAWGEARDALRDVLTTLTALGDKLDGITPSTMFALGLAIGQLDKTRTLIGRDLDEQAR